VRTVFPMVAVLRSANLSRARMPESQPPDIPMKKSRVFISHAAEDSKFAEQLRGQLKAADLANWLDVSHLEPGQQFQPAIEKSLRESHAIVVCLSPKSIQSEWVAAEWAFALGAGVKVFPVKAKKVDVAKAHPWLSRYLAVDLSGAHPPWSSLIEALKKIPVSRRSGRRKAEKLASHATGSAHIVARFELEGGKPVKSGDEYSIALSVEAVPRGTTQVTYELHDDSFDQRTFRIDRPEINFETWISSYGDVPVSAAGKSAKKSWRTQDMLGKALRRGHRPMSRAVKRALADIEAN
jgi:hypothetical protein